MTNSPKPGGPAGANGEFSDIGSSDALGLTFGVIVSPVDSVFLRYGYYLKRDTSRDSVGSSPNTPAEDLMASPRRKGVDRVFFILPGRSDYIEKYAHLPRELGQEDGTMFLFMDHRGQGGSGGERSYVQSYETFARDAKAVLDLVAPGAPYCIVAHSMGSLIALEGMRLGLLSPKAVVLCSPLLGLPGGATWWGKLTISLMAACVKMGLGSVNTPLATDDRVPFERNRKTTDRVRYQALQRSPYIIPGATFEWVTASAKAISMVHGKSFLASLRETPVLVLVPADERVVDPKAAPLWAQRAVLSGGLVELVTISSEEKDQPPPRHEILVERGSVREKALKLIVAWLNKSSEWK